MATAKPTSVEVTLEGADELIAGLYKLGERIAKAAESRALKEGGEILRQEMYGRAPVETGKLRESITVSRVKSKDDGVRYVEVGPSKETAWRAKFIEYGTVKMRAKPFMAPAVEAKQKEVYAKIAEVLRNELRKRS